MIKWIARWFNRSPAALVPGAPDAALPGGAADIAPHERHDDIDSLFYRWLAGAPGSDVAPSIENMIIDGFMRLVEAPQSGADLVPRVPAVIPQLLRSLRDESVSGAEFSRQLAQDVVLVAEVIREANGPCYRPSTPVRTIEGAVMLLGQNGMRMLLARVAFRPIISTQSGHFARQAAPLVWRQSEACALAASMLAPAMRANPFEAYLAGLLHNVGLIVAFRLIDRIYTGGALPGSAEFSAALLSNARLLSSRIAVLWEFPATVSVAIAQAGQPGAPPLARVLALADRLATLRMLVDAGQFAADDPFVLEGLAPAELACFAKLSNGEH
jgi:HD-like signal output (HDOD) protein